ncbi:MAG: DNA-binding domain-containing protein [Pseudomonadota bacterium]
MPSLERFQRQTTDALLDSDADCPEAVAGQASQARTRRFNVYRNNRAVSLIENLEATYPVVGQLVGTEFFAAVARAFIDAHPPVGPVMAEYGGDFGEFMAAIPGAQSIPYIADVARIEWARGCAYHAADTPTLALTDLAELPPDSLPGLVLPTHAAVQTIASDWPAGSIWYAVHSDAGDQHPVDMNQSEFVVVTRPAWDVEVHTLAPPTAAFFTHLAAGQSIGEAAEHVLSTNDDFDAGAHLGHLLGLGLFTRPHTPPTTITPDRPHP